ncbi:hypothetical protein F4779DRAFT_633873 [Xylariaceae sp. FL0662B]|nr:hypothetical protein F4779DRAFT_633873 [Xylariaceae sp. FL0662B]
MAGKGEDKYKHPTGPGIPVTADNDTQTWKPYTIPYTGGGAEARNGVWIPSRPPNGTQGGVSYHQTPHSGCGTGELSADGRKNKEEQMRKYKQEPEQQSFHCSSHTTKNMSRQNQTPWRLRDLRKAPISPSRASCQHPEARKQRTREDLSATNKGFTPNMHQTHRPLDIANAWPTPRLRKRGEAALLAVGVLIELSERAFRVHDGEGVEDAVDAVELQR